jgi:putative radical SAM enzyme (TIGR03279 family)
MMDGLTIEKVMPGSIAEELEIETGDRLLAINGHLLRDIIDYNFFSGDEELTLEVVKNDGEVWEIEVERDESESLGLIFPAPVPIRCGNRCVFCFVHQLPKGLRAPLYVKDEDYRLSFLYGNYVTLANIGRIEIERIKEQRLSPLYISVHATDPALREKLLGKTGIIPIRIVMEELAAARITMHCQIVLCPGINDGSFLEQTVNDLAALYPFVASLAVVPLGLTRHRKGLPELRPVTTDYAANFIADWQPRAKELAGRLGELFIFFADEFYIKAGIPFPPLAEYGDLPQLENGVGMIPLFLEEAATVLAQAQPLQHRVVTVVTGESPYRYLADFLHALEPKPGATLRPVAVKNRTFGESVTVSGLVSGRDIIAALEGMELGDLVLIPDVMLKEGEGLFLDDLTLADLQRALHREVVVAEATPWGIYRIIE